MFSPTESKVVMTLDQLTQPTRQPSITLAASILSSVFSYCLLFAFCRFSNYPIIVRASSPIQTLMNLTYKLSERRINTN